MATFSNTFEGLTNGTALTTANTGGSSGTAAYSIANSTNSTITASAAAAKHGDMGVMFACAASEGVPSRVSWALSEPGRAVIDAYFYFPSTFNGGNIGLLHFRNNSGNMGLLYINNTGRLYVSDATGSGVGGASGTSVLAIDTWYRISFAITKGADTSSGTVEWAYFLPGSDTPIESKSYSAANTGTSNVAYAFLGDTTSRSATHTWYADTVRGSSLVSGWLLAYPENSVPIANAGFDQTGVEPYTTVILDGSGSSDFDNDTLSYAWTQTAGASVTLSSTTATQPTFTAPAVLNGDMLTFQLIVNDGVSDSNPDTVSVAIEPHTIWKITKPGGVPAATTAIRRHVIHP